MFSNIALPALVALMFKPVLLGFFARRPPRELTPRLFLALLAIVAMHNLVEVLALNNFVHYGVTPLTEVYGFAYVALLIPTTSLILHISLRLSLDILVSRRWQIIQCFLHAPGVVLLILLLFTGKLVVGFQPFRNTVLRVPGPWYFLFETYMVTYLVAALAHLVYGARATREYAIRRLRNRYWLLALAPTGLLLVYLIIANHFGLAKLTSTIYMPITMTFFLIVTTYATHQHRLFDIEFFIPWSKIRKRKTAFHRRLQATIAEIADLKSVREILQLIADTLHCPVALVGGPRPVVAMVREMQPLAARGREVLGMANFPQETLKTVDRILVASEIDEHFPEVHALMQRHGVGAIVPFHPYSDSAANWMLFGDRFSAHIYSPLDFRLVEQLLDRIGERFLDQLLLLRSDLAQARDELRSYGGRLSTAWEELVDLRRRISEVENQNRALRVRNAALLREQFKVVSPEPALAEEKALDEHLAEFEAQIIRQALASCKGDPHAAARLLGLRPNTLRYKMKRLGIDSDRN